MRITVTDRWQALRVLAECMHDQGRIILRRYTAKIMKMGWLILGPSNISKHNGWYLTIPNYQGYLPLCHFDWCETKRDNSDRWEWYLLILTWHSDCSVTWRRFLARKSLASHRCAWVPGSSSVGAVIFNLESYPAGLWKFRMVLPLYLGINELLSSTRASWGWGWASGGVCGVGVVVWWGC